MTIKTMQNIFFHDEDQLLMKITMKQTSQNFNNEHKQFIPME